MELITILNRGHRFQGFVSRSPRFSADKKSIEVGVRPRKGSAAVCSRCHFPAPGYDQLSEACREIYRKSKRRRTRARVGVNFQPRMPLTREEQRLGAHPDEDGGSVFSRRDPVFPGLCRDFLPGIFLDLIGPRDQNSNALPYVGGFLAGSEF